jgi:hypothetical protein
LGGPIANAPSAATRIDVGDIYFGGIDGGAAFSLNFAAGIKRSDAGLVGVTEIPACKSIQLRWSKSAKPRASARKPWREKPLTTSKPSHDDADQTSARNEFSCAVMKRCPSPGGNRTARHWVTPVVVNGPAGFRLKPMVSLSIGVELWL